jgi:hypothetical protein
MTSFMAFFFVISMTYTRIARLAVFVLSQRVSDGGASERERVPTGNEPFSKKEMPA